VPLDVEERRAGDLPGVSGDALRSMQALMQSRSLLETELAEDDCAESVAQGSCHWEAEPGPQRHAEAPQAVSVHDAL
jgi:hypothetical protein